MRKEAQRFWLDWLFVFRNHEGILMFCPYVIPGIFVFCFLAYLNNEKAMSPDLAEVTC